MLQRAASNAYSWWWASHIRTKQSKWLEQNLQDMEEKVQNVLKLIEEDGDSFAKRAEMYYKKRPELIIFVEESYREYRAMAERYDHLSTELQNANTTIATVFPEKVQFSMVSEYDFSPKSQPPGSESVMLNVPKVPNSPVKDFKSLLGLSARKLKNNNKQGRKSAVSPTPALKSGLNKDEALKRIDKVQKEILDQQTTKEFVKSSCEGGLARYWEIENQITVMQLEVSALQDEFDEDMVIEDDEARRLMSASALRSCQETLFQLQEKHRKSAEEVLSEQERTKNSWHRFKSLKKEILPGESNGEITEMNAETERLSREDREAWEREQETGLVEEQVKQRIEAEFSDTSLTASTMVEKIDELVEKVIGLETTLVSQATLMERLREENNQLQMQIQALEDDKGNLANNPKETTAQDKIKEMEEKLHGICELNKSVDDQSNNLQTHFAEARLNLECLSVKLSCITPDEEEEIASLPREAAVGSTELHLQSANGREHEKHNSDDVSEKSPKEQKNGQRNRETEASSAALKNSTVLSEVMLHEESSQALHGEEHVSLNENGVFAEEQVSDALTCFKCSTMHCQNKENPDASGKSDHPSRVEERGDGIEQELNWRELFLKGMENREKTLLAEYTNVLRNYKEMKKKLSDAEQKDEEILVLRREVSLLQTVLDESKDLKEPGAWDAAARFPDLQLKVPDDLVHQQDPTSEVEQKLRMDIDQLLEENLEFWLRFSSTLHQIQNYKTAVEDLQDEVRKLEDKEKNQGGSHSRATQSSFRSEVWPKYKHLKEIHSELTIWSEKSMHLKDEQQSRFSSLCNIQEEITRALKASAEDDDFKFTSYQAAKFQGEVLNMNQENNKVANELQAGLDHINSLQGKVDRTLARLNEKLGLPESKNYQSGQLKQAINRTRIPLRSFIFGTKQKKQREPIYIGMSPILPRKDQSMNARQSAKSSQWH